MGIWGRKEKPDAIFTAFPGLPSFQNEHHGRSNREHKNMCEKTISLAKLNQDISLET